MVAGFCRGGRLTLCSDEGCLRSVLNVARGLGSSLVCAVNGGRRVLIQKGSDGQRSDACSDALLA